MFYDQNCLNYPKPNRAGLTPTRHQRLTEEILQKRKAIDALEDQERLMAAPNRIVAIANAVVAVLHKITNHAAEAKKQPVTRPN